MDFSQLDNTDVAGATSFDMDPPAQVAGRVLEFDADFLAYHHGYRWEEESVAASIEHLKVGIEKWRLLAGAETMNLHLTMGNKAGRYELAKVAEYQAQRSERPEGLTERVGELRTFMAEYHTPQVTPRVWLDREADDGLCQAMWADRETGNCVLWSMDKDLTMVGGMHLDPATCELVQYPWGYGSTVYDPDAKKIIGKGTSFFWHQMLMGDTADNIPGLPKITVGIRKRHLEMPKYYTAAHARNATTKAQKIAKSKAVDAAEKKLAPIACGPATAAKILQGCQNDYQALVRVKECYDALYGRLEKNRVAWDGSTYNATASDMLLEQGRLLWMQRTPGQDVLEWITEVV